MVVPGANVTRYIGYLVDVESSTQFRGFNPWDLRLFVIVLVGSLIRPLSHCYWSFCLDRVSVELDIFCSA